MNILRALPPARSAKQKEDCAKTLRILVVEDNKPAADILGMLLEYQGHEVAIAYDGLQALQMVHIRMPDLIFMDLSLPEMNGLTAAREIRKLSTSDGVVIVALSGHDDVDALNSCFDSGFDAHIAKPADPVDVQRLLERLC